MTALRYAGLLLVPLLGCSATSETSDEDTDDVMEAVSWDPGDAPAPDADGITFGRGNQERVYGIQITDEPRKAPTVIYSVRAPHLHAAERVFIRGEMVVSRCNWDDISGGSSDAATTPCRNKKLHADPYDYAPEVRVAVILADGPKDTTGRMLSGWQSTHCSEANHHCPSIVRDVTIDDMPNADGKYINLIAAADAGSDSARPFDVVEVEHHHGQLDVVRVGKHRQTVEEQRETSNEHPDSLPIHHDKDRKRIYQVKLDGLEPGDIVDVEAELHATLGGYSLHPLIGTEVILTHDPNAMHAGGPHDMNVTDNFGSNCNDHSNDGCRYRRAAAIRVGNGIPSTMYLSVLAFASWSSAPSGLNVHVEGDGHLQAKVRR